MNTHREKLLLQVVKLENSDCMQWTGQISNSGFGRLRLRDDDGVIRMQSAHRVSYQVFNGDIPEDKKVIQTCQNRLCINPDHLTLE